MGWRGRRALSALAVSTVLVCGVSGIAWADDDVSAQAQQQAVEAFAGQEDESRDAKDSVVDAVDKNTADKSNDNTKTDKGAKEQIPATPDTSTQPEAPVQPDTPVKPETPTQPEKPSYKAGWNKVGADWYYANAQGQPQTGWVKVSGSWYYLDPAADGRMLTGSYRVNGTLYHARPSGAIIAGNGWVKADGSWWWATTSGALRTGWLQTKGVWYYLDPNTGAMHTGWFKAPWKDKTAWYYANPSGAMQSGGWHKIGNAWYYLSRSGAMATGWLKDKGVWYFLDRSSGDMRANNWVHDSNKWYFVNTSGAMVTSQWLHRGDTWYYLAKSGVMATGWGQIRGVWYFFDRTDGSMAASTSQTIDGKQYWFASSGAMRTDTWVKTAEGTPAFLGSNGVIAYSAQYDEQGRIVTADKTSGWKKIGWAWMYFDKAKNNSLQTGWFKVKGTWYYANSAGIMKTGWQKIGSSWYYLKSNGAMATGWLKLGSTWYYLDPASGALDGGTKTISKMLGISRTRFLSFLEAHKNEYLGTAYKYNWPYPTVYETGPWWSKSTHPYEGSPYDGVSGYGMNCAGFIARVWCDMGLKNTPLMNQWYSYHPWKWANSVSLRQVLIRNNVEHRTFSSLEEMLNSGYLQKGDIVQIESASGADDHVGIFWGNTSSENAFWHSMYDRGSTTRGRNRISSIYSASDANTFHVFKFDNAK